ncbi:AN1-type zinc finger protein Tmc1p [[Candida] jaroonii]|uniref:AN1-type zinc finger protein Tmc1p n=1 Tax=[Candida] jaroonii TaxID=467808 RepID=A0ACA9Y8X0_9ASCO|nr:AN1-type zinc finger protein Tmc1p [[Candida] jaroonii]
MERQITIKLSTEDSLKLTILDTTTVDDLISLIKTSSDLTNFKLINQGKKLTSQDSLSDIDDLILMKEESKKSKKKCYFKNCNVNYLKLVGDCQYCQGKYCHKHRLLENHDCNYLNQYKLLEHQKNAIKLENERTISSRV